MKTIKNKLRSQSGASLLLALLFLLFCVLIGGTVLAAASANGFRVTRMQNKQQELEERSAALLVSDELDMGQKNFTVSIIETVEGGTTKAIEVEVLGGVELTPMQQLTVEMAVCKYLKDNGGDPSLVTLKNFRVTKVADFWYQYGTNSSAALTGTVELSADGLVKREIQLGLLKGKDNYDLSVDFGEGSHVSVQMKAQYDAKDETGTTQRRTVTIWWEDPEIKKEGT